MGGVNGVADLRHQLDALPWIEPSVVDRLTDEIRALVEMGVSLGIVIGGGNILRGAIASKGGMDRVQADYMGMLSTVINALAVQDLLETKNVETRVMTAMRMEEVAEPYIRRRAMRHMEKGRVVLFAGGTGNPYFSTDTAAVLRASEIGAEVVIKATKTDGVYDKDPLTNPDARCFTTLSYDEVLERNLKVMDATAIAFCRDNQLPIIVLDVHAENSILKAVCGESIGTLIH